MMAGLAAGISLPRTTFQQVLVGTPVYGTRHLAPRNLLFSAGSDGTAANPGHVGMDIGSGLVIEAPQTGESVTITPLAGYWQQNTVAIRRIVQGRREREAARNRESSRSRTEAADRSPPVIR